MCSSIALTLWPKVFFGARPPRPGYIDRRSNLQECNKYGTGQLACNTKPTNFTTIPQKEGWSPGVVLVLVLVRLVDDVTHIHVICTKICPKNKSPSFVGKYTIHGAYGYCNDDHDDIVIKMNWWFPLTGLWDQLIHTNQIINQSILIRTNPSNP